MRTMGYLIKRNMKLFFKDKGMLISSLITPIILLVLYITFLGRVYKDIFIQNFPESFEINDKLINGFVSSQLFSSLFAVSCITISFCNNLIMIQDKVTGANNDFITSPVRKPLIIGSYYFSTIFSSSIICFLAMIVCFIYMGIVGWYLSVIDVLLMMLDIVLLVLFGTTLSTILCYPLKTQGQMSAVGTMISSGYGFICGAYMPISQFGSVLQNILSFFPSTYATSLIRNHTMRGIIFEMEEIGFPNEVVTNIKNSVDYNTYFFGNLVEVWQMYVILGGFIIIFIMFFIVFYKIKLRNRKKIS